MKLRSTTFYSVHAKRGSELLTVDIDAETPEEVAFTVQEIFAGRWDPPKDKNGRFKTGVPSTFVKIFRCNKRTKQMTTLTHGNVYKYSPTQVVESIRKALTNRQ